MYRLSDYEDIHDDYYETIYSTPCVNINCVATPLKYRGRDESPNL